MPVKRVMRSTLSQPAQVLRDRLVQEWRQPDPQAKQPVIVEESEGANQPVHVYVIWDEWLTVGSIERSELIMEAYEEVHGKGSGHAVTVAMGLTPAEADQLGIQYQV